MPRAPVSVVIPAHNGGAFIAQALESIFGQTSPPQEVIVIDDGSTDNTSAEVGRFSDVILVRQEQQGQAVARNHGAQLATMPFLSFLDADDLWMPDKTERQLGVLLTNHAPDFVSGQMIQFRDMGAEGRKVISAPASVNLPALMLMRRDTFWKVGPFSARWRVSESVEWWARAQDLGLRVETLPQVVLMRRIHGANIGLSAPNPMSDYLRALHTVVNRRRSRRG